MSNKILISEDGRTVIAVDPETDEEEQFTIEEYEEMYGPVYADPSTDPGSLAEAFIGDDDDESGSFEEDETADSEEVDEEEARYNRDRWKALTEIDLFVRRQDRLSLVGADVDPGVAKQVYYSSLLELTYAVGDLLWAEKADVNAYDAAVFPVQKMLSQYGLKGSHLDIVREAYGSQLKTLENEFTLWSERVGFLPINQIGMQKIIGFLYDSLHRQWLRNKVRKLLETDGELLSIADLMRERYRLDFKKKAKEAKNS